MAEKVIAQQEQPKSVKITLQDLDEISNTAEEKTLIRLVRA